MPLFSNVFHFERKVLHGLAAAVAFGSLVFAVTKTALVGTSEAGFSGVVGGSGFTIAFVSAAIAFGALETYTLTTAKRTIEKANATVAAAAAAAASAANGGGEGARPKPKLDRATIGRLLGLAKPEWRILSLGMIALFINAITQLALPFVFGKLVDSLENGDGSYDPLIQSVVALLIITAVGSLFGFIRGWLFTLAGHRVRVMRVVPERAGRVGALGRKRGGRKWPVLKRI